MARCEIITLYLEINGKFHGEWNTRLHGRATEKNLERWIHGYAKSLEHGGINHHYSKALGRVPYPRHARIVNQKTGEVRATWRAAAFQVW